MNLYIAVPSLSPEGWLLVGLILINILGFFFNLRKHQTPQTEEVYVLPEPIDLSGVNKANGFQEFFLKEVAVRGGYAPSMRVLKAVMGPYDHWYHKLPGGGYFFWTTPDVPEFIQEQIKEMENA